MVPGSESCGRVAERIPCGVWVVACAHRKSRATFRVCDPGDRPDPLTGRKPGPCPAERKMSGERSQVADDGCCRRFTGACGAFLCPAVSATLCPRGDIH